MNPVAVIAIIFVVIIILYLIFSPKKPAATTINPATNQPIPNTTSNQTTGLAALIASIFGHNGNASGPTANGTGCMLTNSDGSSLQGIYNNGICEPIGVQY